MARLDKEKNKEQILHDIPALSDFITNAQELLKDDLVSIIAVGSRTTGEHTPESDVDLDIIVAQNSYCSGQKFVTVHEALKRSISDNRINFWLRPLAAYVRPELFLSQSPPDKQFSLDGYGGICNFILLNEMKSNGVILCGDNVLKWMPDTIKNVPKFEAIELQAVARRDLFAGHYKSDPKLIAKAILRAAYAEHIALTSKTLQNYAEIADVSNDKLVDDALKVKLGKTDGSLDLAASAMFVDRTLATINPAYFEELQRLQHSNFGAILKHSYYYRQFLSNSIIISINTFCASNRKTPDTKTLDVFLRDFMDCFDWHNQRVQLTASELSAIKNLNLLLEQLLEHYTTIGDVPSLYKAASIRLRQLKYDESLAFAEAALASDPNCFRALRFKASSLMGLQKFDAAEIVLKHLSAQKEYDDRHGAFYNLAAICSERKEFGKAIKYLTCALNIYPAGTYVIKELADTFAEFGDALLEKRLLNDATKCYLQAAKNYEALLWQFPNNAGGLEKGIILNDLGVVYGKLGKPDKARDTFILALQAEPTLIVAHINAGDMELRVGDIKKALFYYDMALCLDPGAYPAAYRKGECCEKLGRSDDALACYRQALSSAPPDSKICKAAKLKVAFCQNSSL